MSVWDDADEMLQRARTAHAQGDRELAYQMFARASELSPQDAQAWQGRAETASSSDEALVSYAYAAALEPEAQPLARTLDAAISQRAADARPEDVPLLLALGQELAEVGLTAHAHTLFARAAELEPASTDALVWLAGTTRNGDEQIALLDRALGSDPHDPRARAGLLAARTSAPDESTESTTAPPSPEVAALLAQVETAGDDTERLQLYDRILALDPANLPAREARTNLRLRRLREHGHASASDSAEKSLRRLNASSPDNRLRLVLILLLALVIVLAVAGVILLVFQ